MWGKYLDDEIEIISYENKYEEESLEVIRKSFFLNESVSRASGVSNCEQGQKDLEQLCLDVAKNGVSVVAKYLPTNKIVGVSFNVLQTPSPLGKPSYFENFRDFVCKSESSKSLMQYMITMDGKTDLFDEFQINCLLEIMFLAVLPEFERKGIGAILCECSIDLAKGLKYGKYREMVPEDYKNKRPQLVSALFTSKFSQRIGQKLKFLELVEVPYTEFQYKGKSYAEIIGDQHPSSILVAKQI